MSLVGRHLDAVCSRLHEAHALDPRREILAVYEAKAPDLGAHAELMQLVNEIAGRTRGTLTHGPDATRTCVADSWESSGWREAPRGEALALLARILHLELAYDTEIRSAAVAAAAAREFVELFGNDAKFLTNTHGWIQWDARAGEYIFGPSCAYGSALTAATIEAGIVAISPALLGVLWTKDED